MNKLSKHLLFVHQPIIIFIPNRLVHSRKALRKQERENFFCFSEIEQKYLYEIGIILPSEICMKHLVEIGTKNMNYFVIIYRLLLVTVFLAKSWRIQFKRKLDYPNTIVLYIFDVAIAVCTKVRNVGVLLKLHQTLSWYYHIKFTYMQ